MLETLATILVAPWLLGFATSHAMGGLLHALRGIALVGVVLRVVRGRSVLS